MNPRDKAIQLCEKLQDTPYIHLRVYKESDIKTSDNNGDISRDRYINNKSSVIFEYKSRARNIDNTRRNTYFELKFTASNPKLYVSDVINKYLEQKGRKSIYHKNWDLKYEFELSKLEIENVCKELIDAYEVFAGISDREKMSISCFEKEKDNKVKTWENNFGKTGLLTSASDCYYEKEDSGFELKLTDNVLNRSVADMNISDKLIAHLNQYGINSIRQLVNMNESGNHCLKNLSESSLRYLRDEIEALKKKGDAYFDSCLRLSTLDKGLFVDGYKSVDMHLQNKEEYKNISIFDLNLSTKACNALIWTGCENLYLLIQNIRTLQSCRDLETEGFTEIYEAVKKAITDEHFLKNSLERYSSKEHQKSIEMTSKDIIDCHNIDLNISNGTDHSLKDLQNIDICQPANIKDSDDQFIKMTSESFERKYIDEEQRLSRDGGSYLVACELDSSKKNQQKKGFDYKVIDILKKSFSFNVSCMKDWFGIPRQVIFDKLYQCHSEDQDTWTEKVLLDNERKIILWMIKNKKFEFADLKVKCICLNNKKDNMVCLFIYHNEIKCFFLKDMDESLQDTILSSGFQKFTKDELLGCIEGNIIYPLGKTLFLPKNLEKFKEGASLRRMTLNDYSIFVSGYPLVDSETIIAFLKKKEFHGKIYISSDIKNSWIKPVALSSGESIEEFIKGYGFTPVTDKKELVTDSDRKKHIEELSKYIVRDRDVYIPANSYIYRKLQAYSYSRGFDLAEYLKILGYNRVYERPNMGVDSLENDMQVRKCGERFEEKVFARYPLLGSQIIKQEVLDKLNEFSKRYIDKVLGDPTKNLSLLEEMRITLAVVNNAKKWNYEENSNFWSYIALQFGYRDISGTVVSILQKSIEESMKKNGRLFIEDSNGRAFKSTVVVHALTTKKSWMALCDFLFDFYKNNLNWKVIPGDPLVAVMVKSLQNKLSGNENASKEELNISSKVYSFQEGIRKLVLLRPVYARSLFERMLFKINAILNSENTPVKFYEEQLCEEWFKEKITTISSTKRAERQGPSRQSDVAIDYSRIRAKYYLKDENDLRLVLPDIRLKSGDIERAVLIICYDNSIVYQQDMSWYGNELGKTLHGVSVSLPSFISKNMSLDIKMYVTCDNETIYDSGDTLNRFLWVFYGTNEYNAGKIGKNNFTIVLPEASRLETENADCTEIHDFINDGLKAFFIEPKDGFAVLVDDRLVAVDSENSEDIRVIVPSESIKFPIIRIDETDYYFAFRKSACKIILGKREFQQQYMIRNNDVRVDFSSLSVDEKELVYTFGLADVDDVCRLQVFNLKNEKLIFDQSFIMAEKVECSFNRKYYFSDDDYNGAEFKITIDNFSEVVPFSVENTELRIPYMSGEIIVAVPKIEICESTGKWLNGTAPAWFVGEIPQDSMFYVTKPENVDVRFLVGEKDVMYDGKGPVMIGNVLRSINNTEGMVYNDIKMIVSNSHLYTLARVFYKERFLKAPEFWMNEKKLYWNRGGMFIGMHGQIFTLSLSGEDGITKEFKLDENVEYIDIPDDMPMGDYHFEICVYSGGLFRKVKEAVAAGNCILGDPNLLRFSKRRIVIKSITDGTNEKVGHIPIKECYIDQIKFLGMEETSEGYCPVYTGVLYTDGYNGERYDFAFNSFTNKRGIVKAKVNPVRIVYVGDTVLCITDSDGDGLYYSDRYDYINEKIVYMITDYEYIKSNKHMHLVDLYTYQTERIKNV